ALAFQAVDEAGLGRGPLAAAREREPEPDRGPPALALVAVVPRRETRDRPLEVRQRALGVAELQRGAAARATQRCDQPRVDAGLCVRMCQARVRGDLRVRPVRAAGLGPRELERTGGAEAWDQRAALLGVAQQLARVA